MDEIQYQVVISSQNCRQMGRLLFKLIGWRLCNIDNSTPRRRVQIVRPSSLLFLPSFLWQSSWCPSLTFSVLEDSWTARPCDLETILPDNVKIASPNLVNSDNTHRKRQLFSNWPPVFWLSSMRCEGIKMQVSRHDHECIPNFSYQKFSDIILFTWRTLSLQVPNRCQQLFQ